MESPALYVFLGFFAGLFVVHFSYREVWSGYKELSEIRKAHIEDLKEKIEALRKD